ncbi:MAG: DUF1802 family protein [Chloroflexi bacterium]|nr:DUF1802 family protein [Chloroflexota bacterium]MDA1219693.1 DUF1802 family protein [Chloroflexota bacterium]
MLPDRCQIALKEWAVTVQSLAQGQQILLLRKGGIHEEGKDFRVIHPEFLLYPTYEHQRKDLLKPEHQSTLSQLLSDSPRGETITFTHWAKAEEIVEVSDQEKVNDLSPHHIWADEYAQSRLHWKPMLPLSIMLLRVYRMEQPVTVPYIPEYGGCTSWVEVIPTINLGDLQPVLTDQEFQREVDAIKGSLGLTVTAG